MRIFLVAAASLSLLGCPPSSSGGSGGGEGGGTGGGSGDGGTACTVASCAIGTWCESATGSCLPGCDEATDCPANSGCLPADHTCQCDVGYHLCGATCSRDDAPASCGARCAACPGDPNGVATCTAGTCGLTCNGGALSCQNLCAACPVGAATFQCAGAACQATACIAGRLLCGDQCPACPTGAATTQCSGSSCAAATCQSGRLACQGECPSCPALATATGCLANTCVATACAAGSVVCGGACVPCAAGARFCCKEVVDPAMNTGLFQALALDSPGRAYVAYYDQGAKSLKLARSGPTGFTFLTVDASGGDLGQGVSLAVDAQGTAHLAYTQAAYPMAIKYASVPTVGAPAVETIETGLIQVGATSIAIDSLGRIQVGYFFNGDGHWAIKTVTGWDRRTAMTYGRDITLAIAGTTPFLAASANPSASGVQASVLQYAWLDAGTPPDGGAFLSATVRSTVGVSLSYEPAIAIDPNGTPIVAYTDPNFRDLRLATRAGGAWTSEIVDSNFGEHAALVVSPAGATGIAYVGGASFLPKFVERLAADAGWQGVVIDPKGLVQQLSLAYDSTGRPHVTFYDPDPTLRRVYYLH